MSGRLREMLRTKFVRDAATLQVASTISQGFQVVTTAALALLLGAQGQGLYISAIALQALVFFLINVGVLQATVSQIAAAAARKNEYKSSGWIAFLAKTVAAFGLVIFVAGWFVLPWIGDLLYGDRTIGIQMKATGEVMAIDRSFEAAFQKAVRSLEIPDRSLTSSKVPSPLLR